MAAGTYVVRKGDTMSGIARRYGMSLGTLVAANPQVRNPNLIVPGQRLSLGPASAPVAPASSRVTPRPTTGIGIKGLPPGRMVMFGPNRGWLGEDGYVYLEHKPEDFGARGEASWSRLGRIKDMRTPRPPGPKVPAFTNEPPVPRAPTNPPSYRARSPVFD